MNRGFRRWERSGLSLFWVNEADAWIRRSTSLWISSFCLNLDGCACDDSTAWLPRLSTFSSTAIEELGKSLLFPLIFLQEILDTCEG
ncbi:hypothetical protein ACFX1X_010513 [Malus domestica]